MQPSKAEEMSSANMRKGPGTMSARTQGKLILVCAKPLLLCPEVGFAQTRGLPEAAAGAVGHTTGLVCALSGQRELESLPHFVLWEGSVGRRGLHLVTGVWMSSLLCSPAAFSHRYVTPLTASSQWGKCSCTGGISGHLHGFTYKTRFFYATEIQ